jgi:hypothetical protein
MLNMVIQCFANGATGFNVYTTDGMYDMSLWLAMRDAIALVTPHEDIIMDGVLVGDGDGRSFTHAAAPAVVSGISTDEGTLVASSTVPIGKPTAFTLTDPKASAGIRSSHSEFSQENMVGSCPFSWDSNRKT